MLPFYEWCDSLAISQAYRESLYLFALTQSVHLVAVTTFVGAIAIVDLRLLGWGAVRQSRAELAPGHRESVSTSKARVPFRLILRREGQFAARPPVHKRWQRFSHR